MVQREQARLKAKAEYFRDNETMTGFNEMWDQLIQMPEYRASWMTDEIMKGSGG